jgi:hypothetical protein
MLETLADASARTPLSKKYFFKAKRPNELVGGKADISIQNKWWDLVVMTDIGLVYNYNKRDELECYHLRTGKLMRAWKDVGFSKDAHIGIEVAGNSVLLMTDSMGKYRMFNLRKQGWINRGQFPVKYITLVKIMDPVANSRDIL